MRLKKHLFLLILFVLGMLPGAEGQNIGIKTNFIGDALLSPNLGIEAALASKWSVDLTTQGNFWNIHNHRWRHWAVQPEARYWFCERFAGHFLGVHAVGGIYNFGNIKNDIRFLGCDFTKLADRRYQGWAAGAGVAYGHAWVLGMNWNLEAELGVGWMYTRYDVYPCTVCGQKLESGMDHHYFGPTKAALSLVYLF